MVRLQWLRTLSARSWCRVGQSQKYRSSLKPPEVLTQEKDNGPGGIRHLGLPLVCSVHRILGSFSVHLTRVCIGEPAACRNLHPGILAASLTLDMISSVNAKQWIAVSLVALAIAGSSVWAGSLKFLVFRTVAYMVVVSQSSSNGVPKYSYEAWWEHDLAAAALSAEPTSNQVLAIAINCDSTAASLLVYDMSNSIMTTIAQTTTFDKVQQADPVTGNTNQERFVAVFEVQPVGSLAGGYLTVAGRLHLDTNGCATTVLASKDRDPFDKQAGDQDVAKFDSHRKLLTQRSGQAHLMGVLDVISSGQTNTVLIPSGHLSFCNQLGGFINQ